VVVQALLAVQVVAVTVQMPVVVAVLVAVPVVLFTFAPEQ
jgi:hypothetical protein